MELKYFLVILTIYFMNFCLAGDQLTCTNKQLLFTINNPANSVVNIQLLDSLSQVTYEYSIDPELHPDSEIKSFFIEFSSSSMIMKNFSLDKFGEVISVGAESQKRIDGKDFIFSTVLISVADNDGYVTKSSVNECYSEISDKHSSLLDAFLRVYNSSLLENSKLIAMSDIDRNAAQEHIRKEIDQLMQFSGYRRDSLGVYIRINDTAASY